MFGKLLLEVDLNAIVVAWEALKECETFKTESCCEMFNLTLCWHDL